MDNIPFITLLLIREIFVKIYFYLHIEICMFFFICQFKFFPKIFIGLFLVNIMDILLNKKQLLTHFIHWQTFKKNSNITLSSKHIRWLGIILFEIYRQYK